MNNRMKRELDNYITGHYGEDQFRALNDIADRHILIDGRLYKLDTLCDESEFCWILPYVNGADSAEVVRYFLSDVCEYADMYSND